MEHIFSCRKALSEWRRQNNINSAKLVEELKEKVEGLYADDNATTEEIAAVLKELSDALKAEEMFWKQKSRVFWLREGDRNTEFFHALTKQRRARNKITQLLDENGNIVKDEEGLVAIATSYFRQIFESSNPQDIEEALSEVPTTITEPMNESLTAPVTEWEIKLALFAMHPEKAPGPDGMTALFYQKFWDIVKDDLTLMVNKFLTEGIMPDGLNETNICLIPKTTKPNVMAQFRPISLCNDQAKWAQQKMAIKTDMSTAYDRMELSFIEAVMRKMGFSETWITWIMRCITSVQYKVLMNGQPRGNIIPGRGLFQGDPLSPFIFILCTEALVSLLNHAENQGKITGMRVTRACPSRINATTRQEIKDVLGIQNDGGMGTYLGIPEDISGSKCKLFAFLKDKLMHRVTGWTGRWLSKGGKECYCSILVVLKSPKKRNTLVEMGESLPTERRRRDWISISAARELLLLGIRQKIHSGYEVKVWEDPWIPITPARPAKPIAPVMHPNMRVSDLINQELKEWDVDLLEQYVSPADIPLIRSLAISTTHRPDTFCWSFTRNGQYTVKSGYWVAQNLLKDADEKQVLEPSITKLQAFAWKIKAPKKICHLIWKLLTGQVAVTRNLVRRNMRCDNYCPRCGEPEESVTHAIFECPPALQVWLHSSTPTSPAVFPAPSIYTSMNYLFWEKNGILEPDQDRDPYPWLIWLNLLGVDGSGWTAGESRNSWDHRTSPEENQLCTQKWKHCDGRWRICFNIQLARTLEQTVKI
ncbi:uncharacterized protein LOC130500203 [Raphanus sativus]|uniref:Uncharacterized protein LOC130500203 n=1 Tax=Raphanus sativus TaxID=3726 RepID=A0A9W3CH75_RAPSA|nr:uncharacterized protein LOC130500203 [Raphanus sativus]